MSQSGCSYTTEDNICSGNYDTGFCNGTYDHQICTGTYDDTPPVLSTAVVDGGTLTLTFDEALDVSYVPSGSDFLVSVNGGGNSVSLVYVSDTTVTLFLLSNVVDSDTVDVSYNVNITNQLRDVAGNYVVGFSNQPVTNNTPDTTPPTITSVSSDKADGAYTVGEVIDIDVTFSEAVTSTGNVTITLETGDTDRTCTFTVSNSTTATCNYNVQAGDTSADLDISSISGTIEDQSANPMSDFTPATNLGANKDLLIDTTAPNVSITAPTEGATVSGESVSITANASDINLFGVQFKRATNINIGAEDTTSTYGVTWDTTALSNGTQSLIAVARDTAGNYATSTAVSVTVDNTAPTPPDTDPPVISSPLPSGTQAEGTTSVNLTLTTDESATCKFGTVPETAYVSIASTFTTTGSTSHSEIIAVSEGTSYTYYVRCIDALSNANTTDEIITFSITADEVAVEQSSRRGSSGGGTSRTLFVNTVTAVGTVTSNIFTKIDNLLTRLKEVLANNPEDKETIDGLVGDLKNEFGQVFQTSNQSGSFQFNIDLELGVVHSDVKLLQQFLNNNGYIVALSGPGSLGLETEMYGYATQAAVIRFQKDYNILPSAGYFGPLTRGVVNNLGL